MVVGKNILTPSMANFNALRLENWTSIACDSRMNVTKMMYDNLQPCLTFNKQNNGRFFTARWGAALRRLRPRPRVYGDDISDAELLQVAEDMEHCEAVDNVESDSRPCFSNSWGLHPRQDRNPLASVQPTHASRHFKANVSTQDAAAARRTVARSFLNSKRGANRLLVVNAKRGMDPLDMIL